MIVQFWSLCLRGTNWTESGLNLETWGVAEDEVSIHHTSHVHRDYDGI